MIQQKNKPIQLFQDLQSGHYYRIHKITGQTQKSYKNGQIHKTYRSLLNSPQTSHTKSRVKQKLNDYLKFADTIDVLSNQKLNKEGQYSMQKILNQQQQKQLKRRQFFKTFYQKNIRQNDLDKIDQFTKTTNRFNQLRKIKNIQNHSLKKNIPGSQPRSSPDERSMTNKSFFALTIPNSATLKKLKLQKLNKQEKIMIDGNLTLRNFYKKQRDLFLRSNLLKERQMKVQRDPMRRKLYKQIQDRKVQLLNKRSSKIYGLQNY